MLNNARVFSLLETHTRTRLMGQMGDRIVGRDAEDDAPPVTARVI